MVAQIEQQQQARTERAAREHEGTCFRPGTLLGEAVVYVLTPSMSIYTVHPYRAKPTCNCPDARERCAGTALKCKHVVGVEKWQGKPEPVLEPDEERKARIYRQMKRDFPDE